MSDMGRRYALEHCLNGGLDSARRLLGEPLGAGTGAQSHATTVARIPLTEQQLLVDQALNHASERARMESDDVGEFDR